MTSWRPHQIINENPNSLRSWTNNRSLPVRNRERARNILIRSHKSVLRPENHNIQSSNHFKFCRREQIFRQKPARILINNQFVSSSPKQITRAQPKNQCSKNRNLWALNPWQGIQLYPTNCYTLINHRLLALVARRWPTIQLAFSDFQNIARKTQKPQD